MWARWLNVILGFWLVSSPFVLEYRVQDAQLNDLAVGLAVIILALFAIAIPKLRFANTVLGLWLVLAPFVLGYSDFSTPTVNNIVLGLLIAALSLVWDHRVWTPHRRPVEGT